MDYKKRLKLKSTPVPVYLRDERYDRWKKGAEENGTSLSKYIQQLAIHGEKEGEVHEILESKYEEIRKLVERNQELDNELFEVKRKLEDEKSKHGIYITMKGVTEKGVLSLLTDSPQQLADVVEKSVLEGWTSDLISKPIEDALWKLHEQGKIIFEIGKGWRLKK
jgi:gas vesicle protein